MLHTNIRSSKGIAIYLLTIHVSLVLILYALPIPSLIRLLITLLCIYTLLYTLRKESWRTHPKSIIALTKTEDGNWQLKQKNGEWLNGHIAYDTLITPFLLIINFKISARFRNLPVVIFCDAVSDEALRQLRISLSAIKKEGQ